MREAIVIFVLLAGASCARHKPPAVGPYSAQGPLDRYHNEHQPFSEVNTEIGVARFESSKGNEIQIIGIEQTSCYGVCPEYTAFYCADGTAFYCGRANMELPGCHAGRMSSADYRLAAAAMADIEFFSLSPNYAVMETDAPSVIVFGQRNGEVKTVRDYAEAGPPRLWLLQYMLGEAVNRITWEPIDEPEVDWTRCSVGKTADFD